MSGNPPLLHIDLGPTLNPPFAGFVVSTAQVLSITFVQAWIYANNNKDGWKLRSLVALLVAFDIGTTVLNSMFIQQYLITDFGNYLPLLLISNAIFGEYALTNAVIFIVQLFFASRVYLLNKKQLWVPAIIIFGAFFGSGSGIYALVEEIKSPEMSDLGLKNIKISLILEKVGDLISDGTATVALSAYLYEARSNTQIRQQDYHHPSEVAGFHYC
ncbi:hypothetical protein GALMADRAFT_147560 [Galerina marginata CBS 339.88]|uniref:Uncharacterized protein n=1 Tax=Galerina marginata (strain CBS 339.88) TaxID=685588 RepID=A0A067SGR3_GALM3|nr:hypothetical protein GALMADRAFT_147560 [Galerina marginata CBS 339.88]